MLLRLLITIFNPWGTLRTKPTQGRATLMLIVVRRQFSGGLYCPSPSPPGFPLYQDTRLGLLSPVITLRFIPSGRKPFINGSKGEGQPPARGRGPRGRKKRKRPCLRFFLCRSASCLPAAKPPQRGVLCPPGFSSSQQVMRNTPHGSVSGNSLPWALPFPKPRNRCVYRPLPPDIRPTAGCPVA
jgi:hypothetical protein